MDMCMRGFPVGRSNGRKHMKTSLAGQLYVRSNAFGAGMYCPPDFSPARDTREGRHPQELGGS